MQMIEFLDDFLKLFLKENSEKEFEFSDPVTFS
jgi:hypothetical protein